MLFRDLVQVFQKIERTTLRNEMMTILAELIRSAEIEDVMPIIYLSMGELKPKFDRLEFNLADKMVVRAIARAYKMTADDVARAYKDSGDLGETVESLGDISRASDLSVAATYATLTAIAKDSGTGSQERKLEKLAKLLSSLDGTSAKYIVRIVLGKLRLGFSDKTILDALSYMETGTKDGREALDRAYQIAPDVAELAQFVREKGIAHAEKAVTIKIGRPMLPALAQRLRTADEMIAKMGTVQVEPKYDGTRVQLHFKRDGFEVPGDTSVSLSLFDEQKPLTVRTFTRNLDENTEMFPELTDISALIAADDVILDCEGVGYDPKTGKMVPFQTTITRKRKHGVESATASVPLRFFVFDILYKNGESLINLPLSRRRQILKDTVVDRGSNGMLVVDDAIVTDDPQTLRAYHAAQLAAGLEGALVKKAEGAYLPGRQDWNWVKFKEEEGQDGKLSDTVDAVVMGYYTGKGKRQKFGLGAFLVGIGSGDTVVTLAKIGTGLTDEQFGELFGRLQKCETTAPDPQYVVDKNLNPDVWVAPHVVVEIAADEITKSPIHSSGYALRFPRLVRFRDDKKPSEITTLTELKEIGGISSV